MIINIKVIQVSIEFKEFSITFAFLRKIILCSEKKKLHKKPKKNDSWIVLDVFFFETLRFYVFNGVESNEPPAFSLKD